MHSWLVQLLEMCNAGLNNLDLLPGRRLKLLKKQQSRLCWVRR